MVLPVLAVVSGPPGSGKTTLAHRLSGVVGCPAVCRDEVKEGMVHPVSGYRPEPGDRLTRRATGTFFDVLGVLLRAGVTVVAEAAFQDRVWRPGLESLAGLASVRVVRCVVDAEVARDRIVGRVERDAGRSAHDDRALLARLDRGAVSLGSFVDISLPVPAMRVDTSDDYDPGLGEVAAFVDGPVSAGDR